MKRNSMNYTVEELIFLLKGYPKDMKVYVVNERTEQGFNISHTSKEAGFKGPQVILWVKE